jgi:hypothetical protein
VTDAAGRYRMPLLQPGRYEVTCAAPGLPERWFRSGVDVTVGQQAVVDARMSLGNVAEIDHRAGAAPLVETTTGTISNVVSEQQLGSMPLNGRDVTQLVLLQPGVVMSRAACRARTSARARRSRSREPPEPEPVHARRHGVQRRAEQHARERQRRDDRRRDDQGIPRHHQRDERRSTDARAAASSTSSPSRARTSSADRRSSSSATMRSIGRITSTTRSRISGATSSAVVRRPVAEEQDVLLRQLRGLREHKGITQVATVLDDNARRGILPGVAPITIPGGILPYISLYPVANGR